MAELFNITHDANNLNEYDSTSTDGGDLSTGTPGLAGTTAKMEAFIDDTNSIYGRMSNLSLSGNDLRFRFYVDPNTLSMNTGTDLRLCSYLLNASPWHMVYVRLYYDGSNYQVRTYTENDDSSSTAGTLVTITDAEHWIEIHLERASSNVASDGRTRLWVDGNLEDTVTGIDNYDLWSAIEYATLGATAIDAGITGTLHLDEWVTNDDGGEIGPVPAGGLSIPVAMHYYRMRRSHGATGG